MRERCRVAVVQPCRSGRRSVPPLREPAQEGGGGEGDVRAEAHARPVVSATSPAQERQRRVENSPPLPAKSSPASVVPT